MVFFDSEAYTDIEIHDSEIERARAGEKVEKPHEPYLACANYFNCRKDRTPTQTYKYYDITEPDDFLERLWGDIDAYALSGSRTYVFAHNAKYDMQVTAGVHFLVQRGYKVIGFSDSNPFILRLEKLITHNKGGGMYMKYDSIKGEMVPAPRKKTLIILSSTNFYSQSLKSLGKILQLPKLDFPHGKRVDMNDPKDREQAMTYVKRDVEILTAAMMNFIDFIEDNDLGPFGMTVAGQAFTAYRHRFIKEDHIMIHSNPKALEVERRAYAGGRTECFRLGRIPGRVLVYDINSMYPYVMKMYRYPTRLISFWRTAEPQRVLDMIMDDYLICADVRVRTPDPIFHIKKERLTFPVGDFWTTLTTPELIQAFERDLIVEIKNVCIYEGDNIFEEYVNFFYGNRLQAKEDGNAVLDHLFKIFLNSLYGKFGQKNDTWERVDDADPEEINMIHVKNPDTGKYEWYKVFGGGVFKRNTDQDDQESFNSFPAVAAHVTGYARMLIWSIIEAAGRENVYYTDTDSVFVNETGGKQLEAAGMVDKKRLGALKLEKTGYLWLNGTKDYMFLQEHNRLKVSDLTPEQIKAAPYVKRQLPPKVRSIMFYTKEIKIKGIPKNAVPLGETEDGLLQFAMTQWGGFSDRFKAKDFQSYHNKVVVKTLSRDYTKAMVDGVNVSPFVLDHEEEERQAAKAALEAARKEAAAAMQDDMVRRMCLMYGYMRVPKEGERFRGEYDDLPKVAKLKYFRKEGIPLDIWAEDNGFTVRDLFDYMRG